MFTNRRHDTHPGSLLTGQDELRPAPGLVFRLEPRSSLSTNQKLMTHIDLQALGKLSWVNVPDTPPAWAVSHQLLLQGIFAACEIKVQSLNLHVRPNLTLHVRSRSYPLFCTASV